MAVEIRKEVYEASPGPGKSVSRRQSYRDRGLRRVEHRSIAGESDYLNEIYARYSEDNGRSWSKWIDRHAATYQRQGEMEMFWPRPEAGVYNPVHNHTVAISLQRIFLGNHHDCYRRFWGSGEPTWTDHAFLHVSTDLEHWTDQLVTYEPGADFDRQTWVAEGYTRVNEAYTGANLQVLADGDIIFAIGGNVGACCRVLGVDVREVFPSCPQLMRALIVVRGCWNGRNYDLRPSRPVVISDLKSSRGCDEPLVLPIANDRIIAVFRGSNVISKSFSTRIEAGTPAHKWFCFSDDGGKTFSEAVPWHFDNHEVFYSPASLSHFLRSSRNGRPYWFGNITGAEAYGNSPRYPLVFAEVDERTGFLVKESFRLIDDRAPQTDSEKLQLSNFALLDDRETGTIELYVTKLGANRDDFWRSDAWRYFIELDDNSAEKGR